MVDSHGNGYNQPDSSLELPRSNQWSTTDVSVSLFAAGGQNPSAGLIR